MHLLLNTHFFFCVCYNVQLNVSLLDEEVNGVRGVCTCTQAHTDNWAFCAQPAGSLAAWHVNNNSNNNSNDNSNDNDNNRRQRYMSN